MGRLDAVVHSARELVVGPTTDDPDGSHRSAGISQLRQYEHGAVAVVDGEVAAVGPTDEISRKYPPANAEASIDASKKAVIPGFVDAHTHALFAGDRSDEFVAKLRGKSYSDILAEGGGILRTVRAVREASDGELMSKLLATLDTMLAHGTTTVEVKSGYGLNTETELRMLSIIDQVDDRHSIDLVPTFMGAHAVPEDRTADEYTETVVTEQVPAVADQGVAEFCDVFCEEGVFSVEQSRRVLRAGIEAGLTPKVHAEELTHIGGTKLATEVGAVSADHLLHSTDEDLEALVEAGVTPVLLPGTAFGLDEGYPDAERFFAAGAPVAVATDFNPNCHSENMGFALALACVECGMTPAEALVAGTRNGALALNRDDRGALEPGHRADLLVLDAPTHAHVPYSYGVNRVETVLKDGAVVHGGGDGE